ncbi:MAG: M13 family metallopeptidase [Caulobacterales bacterium]
MHFKLWAGAALAVCLMGCATTSKAPEPAAAKLAPKAQLGAFGLETRYIKADVKPGDDFFKYANGGWLETAKIPADRSSYGAFAMLDELSEQRVRSIVEDLSKAPSQPGSVEQKIGDLYSSWMDEAAIEAKGLKPAEPDLARIDAVKSYADLAELFGSPGFMSPLDFYVDLDAKNTDRYLLNVTQGGLGLPDRDYYLKANFADARAAYQKYIVQILTLGGASAKQAATDAKTIMALETRIAKAHWPVEKRRERDLTYNIKTVAELKSFARGMDWDSALEGMGAKNIKQLNVNETSAIKSISAIVRQTPLPQWKTYSRFHYLSSHAQYLPKAFDDAAFNFYGKTLEGREVQRDRWKRGVDVVEGGVGEAVGQVYVARFFSGDAKAKMEDLVKNVKVAMKARLEGLAWMSPDTKAAALKKLDNFGGKIGYPDKWRDYSGLEIKPGDLFGNAERTARFNLDYDLGRLTRPVDRAEWLMTPQTVNAYYWPEMNEIVFPAAILQPPFFDPYADPAINYGAIGMVIGHEISHGFDDQGRKSDEKGLLRDWWTKADVTAFNARTDRLDKQYSATEPLPGFHINGKLTMGENIADLAGMLVAYDAYKLSLNGQPAPVLDGLTGDQRFFMGEAQVWRSLMRDEALKQRLATDPHSPAKYRVNNVVRNVDAWYAAFNVQPGDALYLKAEDRVRIW